jgi:hypothetical protein
MVYRDYALGVLLFWALPAICGGTQPEMPLEVMVHIDGSAKTAGFCDGRNFLVSSAQHALCPVDADARQCDSGRLPELVVKCSEELGPAYSSGTANVFDADWLCIMLHHEADCPSYFRRIAGDDIRALARNDAFGLFKNWRSTDPLPQIQLLENIKAVLGNGLGIRDN